MLKKKRNGRFGNILSHRYRWYYSIKSSTLFNFHSISSPRFGDTAAKIKHISIPKVFSYIGKNESKASVWDFTQNIHLISRGFEQKTSFNKGVLRYYIWGQPTTHKLSFFQFRSMLLFLKIVLIKPLLKIRK